MRRILDLFCCSGGAARGYERSGLLPYGVDIVPRDDYQYKFIMWDALSVMDMLLYGDRLPFTYAGDDAGTLTEHLGLEDFGAFHASPPCQKFASLVNCRPGVADTYPDLIEGVRERLAATGRPYVIENVPGSPLKPTVTLCGTQFGRRFMLHRVFETNFPVPQPECRHEIGPFNPENNPGRQKIREEFPGQSVWGVFCREKGVDFMRFNGEYKKQAREAISPYYTEYVGRHVPAFDQHTQRYIPSLT